MPSTHTTIAKTAAILSCHLVALMLELLVFSGHTSANSMENHPTKSLFVGFNSYFRFSVHMWNVLSLRSYFVFKLVVACLLFGHVVDCIARITFVVVVNKRIVLVDFVAVNSMREVLFCWTINVERIFSLDTNCILVERKFMVCCNTLQTTHINK